MKLEIVALDQLSIDPLNARTHNKRNLDAIKASLKANGQQKPIVVKPSGSIVAGNGTYTAAKELGWPTLVVKRFEGTDEEARAFAIADNRTAELAAWDAAELVAGLEEFGKHGNILELGFTNEEFGDMKKIAEKLEGANQPSFRDSLNYKLTYELVFETHDEQKDFFGLIRTLNTTRTETTVAARLLAFMKEHMQEAE